MGAIADAVLARDGDVVGVIPKTLVDREVAHHGLRELHVVHGMHERKAMMASLSGAFIAMPGGLGTLEELFEVITWAMLGIHSKPIGLLDTDGYWDGLRSFLDRVCAEGFAERQHVGAIVVDADPERLVDKLLAAPPMPVLARPMRPSES
jgi:uncharacterized protein (TIGR00730 family)